MINTVALLVRSSQFPIQFCVKFPLHARVFSRYSSFLSQSKQRSRCPSICSDFWHDLGAQPVTAGDRHQLPCDPAHDRGDI